VLAWRAIRTNTSQRRESFVYVPGLFLRAITFLLQLLDHPITCVIWDLR